VRIAQMLCGTVRHDKADNGLHVWRTLPEAQLAQHVRPTLQNQDANELVDERLRRLNMLEVDLDRFSRSETVLDLNSHWHSTLPATEGSDRETL
jgi:hypothetical protein